MPSTAFHTSRLVILAAALAAVAIPAPAQAQSPGTSWNCRASVARVTLGNAPIEPLRANTGYRPCADESAGAATVGVPNSGQSLVTADAVKARTELLCASVPVDLDHAPPVSDRCDALRPLEQKAVARAEAANVDIELGSGDNAVSIEVDGVSSAVQATCDAARRPTFTSTSNLVGLSVNNEVIALPRPGQEVSLNLGIVKLVINERVATPTSLTRRALHVTLPSGGQLVDLVLGESAAGFNGDACSPSPGSTGGTIVPLRDIPGHRGSPCRGRGFGPLFGLLGTNGRDRITGSNFADRIFALAGNDDVSGGRGNDCIEGDGGNDNLDGSNGRDYLIGRSGRDILSGGPGNDRLSGGASRDRLNGGTGNDRLRGGNGSDKLRGGDGNDRIIGGRGNDGILTGNGRDRVNAGPGNDVVNAAIRGPAARINCGSGRDRVRVNGNEIHRIRNCEFVDVFRRLPRH